MSTRQTKLVITVVFLFCFLFLARGGWLPTPIRLDTGDSPGENYSGAVKISASGNNVYAVWSDSRNGYHTMGGDIYFNYSNDRGAIWQSSDIRLDTGDAPGASASNGLQISSSGSNVYVVWADKRHGKYDQDIYFNYSTDG